MARREVSERSLDAARPRLQLSDGAIMQESPIAYASLETLESSHTSTAAAFQALAKSHQRLSEGGMALAKAQAGFAAALNAAAFSKGPLAEVCEILLEMSSLQEALYASLVTAGKEQQGKVGGKASPCE